MAKASGSIVLSKRIESDGYSIVSSAEDIVRFKAKSADTGLWGWETSPQRLRIQIYRNGTVVDLSALEDNENISLTCFDETSIDISSYTEIGEEVEEGRISTDTLFFNAQMLVQNDDFFKNDSIVFVCEYKVNNKIVASKAFQLRDGVGPEMATFEVTAAAINQSVGSSKMSFTQDGLEIIGGNFQIKKDTGMVDENGQKIYDQLLGFNGTEDGSKLTVRGAIYAEEGSFTGEIHATSAKFDGGTIGGFNISQNKLTSIGTIEQDDEEVPAIELDGNNGQIIARNIQLGDSATIMNRIQLGNAYLFNPTLNKNKLLQVGSDGQETILIKDDGTASFGKIFMDGGNSKLYGQNWTITPTLASFSNVAVSGAIKTAIFETEATQAVGGAMVFLPSYKIELDGDEIIFQDHNNQTWKNKLWGTQENSEGELEKICRLFAQGGRAWLVSEYNIYNEIQIGVDTENEKITISERINGDWTSFSPVSLIYIGLTKNENENITNPLIMGINSGSVKTAQDHLYGRGLTLTEYGQDKPNLFLGDFSYLTDLSNDTKISYTGYGLYADNVYLNGSITTKIKKENEIFSYAGINTLSNFQARKFGNDDTSNIVFWAGATSIDEGGVTEAPFQVTEDGSVYASRMKLENGLIVGGIIQAGEIQTAKLRGNGSALSIYDGTNGIQFMRETNEVLFSIDIDGMKTAADKPFVSILDNKVSFVGNEIKTENKDVYLSLTTTQVNDNITPVLRHYDNGNTCGIYFEPVKTYFKMGDDIIQTWESSGTTLNGKLVLDGTDYKLEYETVDGGRNLYVVATSTT